jgi:RimJ/RimL family protein N-acetyltransferase
VTEVPAGDLLLRAWRDADAPYVLRAAADPDVRRWNPMDVDDALAWLRRRADWSGGTHASWAVVHSADRDQVLGSVSLHRIAPDARSCEIGFWIMPDARRRGVAARAARAAAAFGFAQRDLLRITLFHAVDNPGSCGVARAAGFAQEGVHRQSHRYGDGVWHDEHSHARLAGDEALPD